MGVSLPDARNGSEVSRWVERQRPPLAHPGPGDLPEPLLEEERTREGRVEPVATLFLANRECAFRCVFCDLWRHARASRLAPGEAVAQVLRGMEALVPVPHVKLYNAGSLFDPGQVPREDLPGIARLLSGFRDVVVESHPAFARRAPAFRDALGGAELEVAMGLETAEEAALARMNKRMTVAGHAAAARWLRSEGIHVRTFLLHPAPFVPEEEAEEATLRSVGVALDAGSGCVVLVPTRSGNGAMEALADAGLAPRPTLASLERVLARALALSAGRGRVFVDLWDLPLLAAGVQGWEEAADRLREMNDTQRPAGA